MRFQEVHLTISADNHVYSDALSSNKKHPHRVHRVREQAFDLCTQSQVSARFLRRIPQDLMVVRAMNSSRRVPLSVLQKQTFAVVG